MKGIRKFTRVLFALAIVLVLIPISSVQAATSDIKIVSETKVTAKQAGEWAKSKGASTTFIGLADLYWKYAADHGQVNPGIAYVQAAKETGFGKFGGVLDESYHNPCGLKTTAGGSDTDPNAHKRFNTWDEGVQAHLDHLALYAGASGYPRSTTYDPRHFVTVKGNAVTVNALGGKWAPSLTYGEEVNKLYNDLLTFSGTAAKDKVDTTKVTNSTSKTSGTTNSSTNTSTKQGTNSGENKSQAPANTTAPKGVEVTEPIKQSTNKNTTISSSIGWKLEGGQWYYYKSNGSKATGWIKPDSNWYYLYSDGVMAKGWLKDNGKWYYFKSGGAMQYGWFKDGGKWYYSQGDGSMINGFKLIDGSKYFFDVSGAMRIGWFQISGQWYYFNTGGNMLTGWIKPDGKWYYLHSNGIMATGWLNLNGETYYLNSSGVMATGWISDGGNYYYLKPGAGTLVKGTVINGWQIGPDGKRGAKVPGSASKVIVIDPGHNYGGDDGAYADNNGITYSERDLNMQVAVKLKAKLESQGYTVIMTRNQSDREKVGATESLTKRVNVANNAGADLFISIHHNSASAAAKGVEVYYSSRPQDEDFGGNYSDSRVSASSSLASSISSAISNSTGAINRGAKDGNLFVCRNTTMTAVLVECGFISNPDEARNCADSSYQDLEAEAIASAVASAL